MTVDALQILRFEETPVTFGLHEGAPVVAATDLSEALGYTQRGRLSKLIRNEWVDRFKPGRDYHLLDHADAVGTGTSHVPPSTYAGGLFLTEAGIYKVLICSRRPNALAFQDWLVDEVLPQLVRTGEYSPARYVDQDGQVVDRSGDTTRMTLDEFERHAKAKSALMRAEAALLTAQAKLERTRGASKPKTKGPSKATQTDILDVVREAIDTGSGAVTTSGAFLLIRSSGLATKMRSANAIGRQLRAAGAKPFRGHRTRLWQLPFSAIYTE